MEKEKKSELVRTIAEVAIFAALGYVLDFLAGTYSASIFPNGGSIGIAMSVVLFVAFRRGTIPGVACGLIIGLLDLADGFYAIASEWWRVFLQVMLDYWIAYPLVGLAGLFRKIIRESETNKKRIVFTILASSLGGLLKFFSHFLAGALFWADPSGFVWPNFANHPYLYCFLYNGAYMLPCIVLSTAFIVVLLIKAPNLFGFKKIEKSLVKQA